MTAPPCETRPLRALAHEFLVESTEPWVCRLLDDLFGSLAFGGLAQVRYSIDLKPEVEGAIWSLSRDGSHITTAPTLRHAIDTLLWHVNRAAIAGAAGHLVLHAAAAEWRGRAIVFPGRPGAGKSTLVSALVRRGWGYLTDEAAAIDGHSLTVLPYPKPVCIEPSGQFMFTDLTPVVGVRNALGDGRWLVPPETIRPGAVARPCKASQVVVVSHQVGGGTFAHRLSPGEAALAVGEHWFRPEPPTAADLDRLARLVRTVPVHRLQVDDIGRACDTVIDIAQGCDLPTGPTTDGLPPAG